MRFFTDQIALIRCIRSLSLRSPGIISIDGADGVGKSTLACKIAEELAIPHVEIDTFVPERQGGYVAFIDYDRLRETIGNPIIANQVIIVEGICVQQVLRKLALTSSANIYVRIVDGYGLWMDQVRLFPPDRSADEMIAERKAKRYSLGHVEEIIRYHYDFKPHENADYIFERSKL